MAASSKRSRTGAAGSDVALSDARLPHSKIVSKPDMSEATNAHPGRAEAEAKASTRNGTVTRGGNAPILRLRKMAEERRLNADAPHSRETRERQDLRTLGIGLVSSHTEVAKTAEALLRQRYDFASADDAETLVALGGDGFMLQTLHDML